MLKAKDHCFAVSWQTELFLASESRQWSTLRNPEENERNNDQLCETRKKINERLATKATQTYTPEQCHYLLDCYCAVYPHPPPSVLETPDVRDSPGSARTHWICSGTGHSSGIRCVLEPLCCIHGENHQNPGSQNRPDSFQDLCQRWQSPWRCGFERTSFLLKGIWDSKLCVVFPRHFDNCDTPPYAESLLLFTGWLNLFYQSFLCNAICFFLSVCAHNRL